MPRFCALLIKAGVPADAVQLLHGPGHSVGAALVAAPGVAGVVFTGSTEMAKLINRALAAKDGPIVPLIAETGGINAMLVDSTALPEQVSDAVLQSAFRSAGHYLVRFCAEQTITINTTAAGGNVQLLAWGVRERRLPWISDQRGAVPPFFSNLAVTRNRSGISKRPSLRLNITPILCNARNRSRSLLDCVISNGGK